MDRPEGLHKPTWIAIAGWPTRSRMWRMKGSAMAGRACSSMGTPRS